MNEFGSGIVILLAVVALLGSHIALLIAARYTNIMFLLASAYFVVSPLSSANEVPSFEVFKYARAYITVLMVVLGIAIFRLYSFGTATKALLIFVLFYCLGTLWSGQIVWAALYKGNWLLAVLSGVLLAMSVRNLRDLHIGLRVVLVGSAMVAVFFLSELITNPSMLNFTGRFVPWGINPNRVGQTIAPLAVLTAFVALYDPQKLWKFTAYLVLGGFGVLLLATGSRGGLGMALIGICMLLVSAVKRPGLIIFAVAFVSITLFTLVQFVTPQAQQAFERLTSLSFESRDAPWSEAWRYFSQRPILGQGWVWHDTGDRPSTSNMHSIYLQTLVELGVFGITVLGFVLTAIGACLWKLHRSLSNAPAYRPYSYLSIAAVGAILAHGVIESGTMMGSTLNAVLLGFGVGLADRLPALIHQQIEANVQPQLSWPAQPQWA